MKNIFPYELLEKAWEEEVTEEVEDARRETISSLLAAVDRLKEALVRQKETKEEVLDVMQGPDITKEDMSDYEDILGQMDSTIYCGERLYEILNGIVVNYQRIWRKEQLSYREQKEHRKWLFESLVFLMKLDECFRYEE